jgi:hypothetical protein
MTTIETTTKVTTTYKVRAERLSGVEELLARINRRAAKMDLAPVRIEVVREWDVEEVAENGVRTGRLVGMAEVVVAGEAPVLRGWTFLAAIDHLADGNVVRAAAPLDEGTLAAYRATAPDCDHCRTYRARTTTYVLRHDDGRTVQVGSTCVARFVGADADAAMLLVELLGLLRDALDLAAQDEDFADQPGSAEWARYDLASYLAHVHACVRTHGWVARSAGRGTADRALDAMRPTCPEEVVEVTEADVTEAAQSLAWLDRQAEVEVEDRSDYLHNVVAACASHVVGYRHLGLAASIVAARAREEGEATRRESSGVRNEYLPAEVGARVKGLRATLREVQAIEGYYGVTMLHRFVSEEGYVLTWWASGASEFEVGHAYALTATIKRHEERRGARETVVTRVVETPEPKARKRAA